MPQSARSHTALDPLTHFVLGPIFLLNLGYVIRLAAHAWPYQIGFHLWLVVLSSGFVLLNIKTRLYSLRLQDRMIRLEERQRLGTLLNAADLPRTAGLTTGQLIALRFASDAELPALAVRASSENLSPKTIKSLIVQWRPDWSRV